MSDALGSLDLNALYERVVMDHYRDPRNTEPLSDFDVSGEAINPFCGDEVRVQLSLTDNVVQHVAIESVGCSICQASASLMGEAARNRTPNQIEHLSEDVRNLLQGGIRIGPETDHMGELAALAGVRAFPIRIKCALLGWNALISAIRDLPVR